MSEPELPFDRLAVGGIEYVGEEAIRAFLATWGDVIDLDGEPVYILRQWPVSPPLAEED